MGSSQQSEEPSTGHESIKNILILSLRIRSDLRFSSSCDAFARCGTCCRLSATCPPNAPWAVATGRRFYATVTCVQPPVRSCGTSKLTLILKYWRWIFSLKGKILVIWNFSRFDFILITFTTQINSHYYKSDRTTPPPHPHGMKMTHLVLQKRRVDRETGPEVSQQLSSSCIKMLQLSLDITGDHLWVGQGLDIKQ